MMSRDDLMREERDALLLCPTPTLPPPTGGRCPEGVEGVAFVFCLGIMSLLYHVMMSLRALAKQSPFKRMTLLDGSFPFNRRLLRRDASRTLLAMTMAI